MPPVAGRSAEQSREARLARGANPIDAYVGARVRLRRTLLGMSQEKLADALDLTFQQIQKYERGMNRIGASNLYKISQVLHVPVSYFFDDMPEDLNETSDRKVVEELFNTRHVGRRETINLVRYFYQIPDEAIRSHIVALMERLAEGEDDLPENNVI